MQPLGSLFTGGERALLNTWLAQLSVILREHYLNGRAVIGNIPASSAVLCALWTYRKTRSSLQRAHNEVQNKAHHIKRELQDRREGRQGELRCFCPVGHSRIRPSAPHWSEQLSGRVLIAVAAASPLSQECAPVCSRTWSLSKPCSVSSAGLWPRSTSSSTAAQHPLLLKEVSKANLEGQKLDKISAVHLICCNYTVNNLIITGHVHFFTQFSNCPMTWHKCCEDYVKVCPKDSYFSQRQWKRWNVLLFG